MRRMRGTQTVLAMALSAMAVAGARAEPPEWSGAGGMRVLVRVAPVDLKGRAEDQLVAAFSMDFEALHQALGVAGVFNPASIQVHRYDPESGAARDFPAFSAQGNPCDVPCRFEDSLAAEDFPDRAGRASAHADGRVPAKPRARAARLFNREMDPRCGRVVWVHHQQGDQPAFYALYWDAASGVQETGPTPMPWLGDVDVYRLPEGQALAGFAHVNAGVGDFNGDGLFDLATGAEKGEVNLYLNRGTAGSPRFLGARLPRDEEGPLDCGWYAAPLLYDWDNDGRTDLICGTSGNVLLWWKNTGDGGEEIPALAFQGPLQADGRRLEVPEQPVPEDHAGIFKADYYNQPCIADWNADGLPDLLTGGYTTGHIFLYLATGRDAAGVPALAYAGEVEADGAPIDTVWAASPLAVDVDNDGLLELISGSWNFQAPAEPGKYLLYYENTGTCEAPRLERRHFPKSGDFPDGTIARPAAVDWNHDGLIDLLVADNGGRVQYAINTGSATAPCWQFDPAHELAAPWAFVQVSLLAAAEDDSGGAGKLFLSGSRFEAIEGSPHLPKIAPRGEARAEGRPIVHESPPYGDAYNWNTPADWDGDGLVDVLSATFQGGVYLHRNAGFRGEFVFNGGEVFSLSSGEPLKVGPPTYADKSQVRDFTELQGSRSQCLAADFDGDGIPDLAVTETYGNIWIFLNQEAGASNALLPGVVAVKMPARSAIATVDWNEDGRPDLLSGLPESAPGTVYLNESTPGRIAFGAAQQPFQLPYTFYGANFFPSDWNRDGDTDFLIRSEFYLFWAEKSFLMHGYREGVALGAAEKR